jgi:hypothetical protein
MRGVFEIDKVDDCPLITDRSRMGIQKLGAKWYSYCDCKGHSEISGSWDEWREFAKFILSLPEEPVR